MDEFVQIHRDQQISQCKKALKYRGFHVDVAENKEELLDLVNAYIKDKDHVSDGGSQTLKECGIIASLNKRNIRFHSHSDASMTREESDLESRNAFFSDVFLMSANAITMQGEIINVDGHGNRVSAMIFGPKKVLIIAGYNKIVWDEDAAKKRIQTISAPTNCLRLHRQTPCAVTGACQDCHSKDRICSSYVKLSHDNEHRIHVILVKEILGY